MENSKSGQGTLSSAPLATYLDTGMIIFLNGFPGVGKLTIGKLLTKLIPSSRLIDNHLMIDPAESIEPHRSQPEYRKIRQLIRESVIKSMILVPQEDVKFIITSCKGNILDDLEVVFEFVEVARKRNAQFVFVNLACDMDVNLARAQSKDRCYGTKTKLTDAEVLKKMLEENDLLDPRLCPERWEGISLRYLFLDVSGKSAEESAICISEFVSRR